MPRFYFDYEDSGTETGQDTEGTELSDVAAALEEAGAALGEMTREVLRSSKSGRRLQIRVRDEQDQAVFVCSVVFEARMLKPNPD